MVRKRPINYKFTIWEMFSNIFVAAINKGQLPVAILGLLLVIWSVRIPATDLSAFISKIIENLKSGYLLGYFLFIMALACWFFFNKRLRRQAYNEQERIGLEKSELQAAALPGKVKSSKQT